MGSPPRQPKVHIFTNNTTIRYFCLSTKNRFLADIMAGYIFFLGLSLCYTSRSSGVKEKIKIGKTWDPRWKMYMENFQNRIPYCRVNIFWTHRAYDILRDKYWLRCTNIHLSSLVFSVLVIKNTRDISVASEIWRIATVLFHHLANIDILLP